MEKERHVKSPAGNDFRVMLLSAAIGSVVGIIFWLFLFALHKGIWVIWELLPEKVFRFSLYPLAACTVGGLIVGLFRKRFGDYPEDMMTVFGKLKKNKTYPYRKLAVISVAALLPLIFGSSVGPEAGMVGVVVSLCCWAGENLSFAAQKSADYSRVGAAVSLSVLFRSPLFGILDVEDGLETDAPEQDAGNTGRLKKIIVYCVATGAGFGCFALMNRIFGKLSEGFPSFDTVSAEAWDYPLAILYLALGILLGLFFEITEKLLGRLSQTLPPVLRETVCGLLLGAAAVALPVIRFSGEEQMAVLITDFAKYTPLAMIGIAFLKVLITNLCIRFGMKGGHFFPLIFAAVCLGYGVSLLIFPGNGSHAVFAAAIVVAGTLGVTLKKPLAVSVLMLLCFPVKALIFIVPAAALAVLAGKAVEGGRTGKKPRPGSTETISQGRSSADKSL